MSHTCTLIHLVQPQLVLVAHGQPLPHVLRAGDPGQGRDGAPPGHGGEGVGSVVHDALYVIAHVARYLSHLLLTEDAKVGQGVVLYVFKVDLDVRVAVPPRVLVPHAQRVAQLVDHAAYDPAGVVHGDLLDAPLPADER